MISDVPSLLNAADTQVGKACFTVSLKNNNRIICALFQQNVISVPSSVYYWNNFVSDMSWKKVWMSPHKFLINNKMRELSFRLLHRICPTNHYLMNIVRMSHQPSVKITLRLSHTYFGTVHSLGIFGKIIIVLSHLKTVIMFPLNLKIIFLASLSQARKTNFSSFW